MAPEPTEDPQLQGGQAKAPGRLPSHPEIALRSDAGELVAKHSSSSRQGWGNRGREGPMWSPQGSQQDPASVAQSNPLLVNTPHTDLLPFPGSLATPGLPSQGNHWHPTLSLKGCFGRSQPKAAFKTFPTLWSPHSWLLRSPLSKLATSSSSNTPRSGP